MRKFIKERMPASLGFLLKYLLHISRQGDNLDRKIQVMLALQYQQMIREGVPLPSFDQAEFQSYTQNAEDGTLLMIFSAIGHGSKKAVELCASDGIECNAANLIINHGWNGLLFDGDAAALKRGRVFYSRRTNAWRARRLPPKLVQAWITRENVDDLITSNGMSGEIDLLSLDLDGVDWYIWEAINSISPRVVVLEYNNRWGPEKSVTVPYRPDFVGVGATVEGEGYFGASLAAFNVLAKRKGYRLIGANSPNTNAYFMRNDVGEKLFPEVSVESCLASDYARHQQATKDPSIGGELVEIR